MNLRCTICDAVLTRGSTSSEHCPECGARSIFQVPTTDAPRHGKYTGGSLHQGWDFSPDGPVLRRIH